MKPMVSSAFGRVLPLAVLVAGLSGCSTQAYNVKVDAIQNPEITTGYSYRIIAKGAPATGPEGHQAAAVEAVRVALAQRGMYEAADPQRAEVEVLVDSGLGRPRLKIEGSARGWAPDAAQSWLALLPVRRPDGTSAYIVIPPDKLDYDGTFRGLPVLRGVPVFEKYLTIVARETQAAVGGVRKPAEAWQVRVSLEDAGERVDEYLPVLAGAATEYLGTSTGGIARVSLRPRDLVVLAKTER